MRALAIPARRVVTALQNTLSPQPVSELLREAQYSGSGGNGINGSMGRRQHHPPLSPGGQQQQRRAGGGSAPRGVPGLAGAADAGAVVAGAAEESLLAGSVLEEAAVGGGRGSGGDHGLSALLLHHSISAPTQLMPHLEQAAWEDEERRGGRPSPARGSPGSDLEQQ